MKSPLIFILSAFILVASGFAAFAEETSKGVNSMKETHGGVTFKGNPLTLAGNELKVGDVIPDFKLLANDLSEVKLADTKGVRIFTTVPSLDTPVCDLQIKRFNEEAGKLPNVSILVISADLPFAQARWCGAAGAKNVKTLSDHREMAFAASWGLLVKELRLVARSVFVVDSNNKIVYKELVKEIATAPNYDAALTAIKSAK